MYAIEAEGLVKRFGAVEALRGVTFQVEEGELFAFLGPNGAGKTTTIHILCTLLRPTQGVARVNRYDVVRQPDAVRRSIGLVFQEPTLDEYLTAEENLRFHAYAYGLPKGEREERIRRLLQTVELWDRRKDLVRTFSGGMKRRLELARGLLHRPRVLFLDEPTLGLDPQTRRRVWDYILQVHREEGITLFLTTHYLEEAEYARRIAIIDHGRIIALDTPEALKDSLGGDIIRLQGQNPEALAQEVRERFRLEPKVRDGTVEVRVRQGAQVLPELVRGLSQPLEAVSLHRPSLDDVFLHLTGRALRDERADGMESARIRMRTRR